MDSILPQELWYMICKQLMDDGDSNTLFNLACTGKQLAFPAVNIMYRMYDYNPITGSSFGRPFEEEDDYEIDILESQELVIMRRAQLWRTIIRSSRGYTMYPYSQYIRLLNLRLLGDLLERPNFHTAVSEVLSTTDPEPVNIDDFKPPRGTRAKCAADVVAKTLSAIGEAVTKQALMVEGLTGTMSPSEFCRWIPRMPRLGHMDVRRSPRADRRMASFLGELRPQRLESLEIFNESDVALESFTALSTHHGQSLTHLTLGKIKPETMPAIPLLKGCTNLIHLSLGEFNRPETEFNITHRNEFDETVAWLRQCTKLRTIELTNFRSAPALMTPVLWENSVQLVKLHILDYKMCDAMEFHRALSSQISLKDLFLRGEPDYNEIIGTEVLVQSLSKLTNLTDLEVRKISDRFTNRHILKLARSLLKLKYWSTGGHRIDDVIWNGLLPLRSLKWIEFTGHTIFTSWGILGFVSMLQPYHRGLVLDIMAADVNYDLSGEEIARISKVIKEKVKGRFDFYTWEDPDDLE